MEEMPVFVKVEVPKDVKQTIDLLRSKVDETKLVLSNIESLSAEESAKLSEWRSKFDSINEKLSSINRNLVEPERI